MAFSGLVFLYYFLPGALALYMLAPGRWRRGVLLLESLLFYAWAGPAYVPILLFTVAQSYILARLMAGARSQAGRRGLLGLSLALSLGTLLVFKYADFLLGTFNGLPGVSLPLLKLTLPLGISFFTFEAVSYTVDVYTGRIPAEKDLLTYATWLCMFPKLTAGPIARYGQSAPALTVPGCSWKGAANGARRFILGLGKKVLLAEELGLLVTACQSSASPTVVMAWLGALGYTLQLYFDFSGYSDMAIGLGWILGLPLPENFDYPYLSRSLTEFWRRWHITLGSFFRDYIYIPLGGSRKGRGRQILNLWIVWLLTGLWHGAGWNFILWGLLFWGLLVVEKLFLLPRLEKGRVWPRVYVLFFLLVSFTVFSAGDLREAVSRVAALFSGGGEMFFSRETGYYLQSYGILLLLGIVGATPLPRLLARKLGDTRAGRLASVAAEPLFLLTVLLLATAALVDGSFSPFMYFRF